MQRRQVLPTENDNNNKQEISSGKLRLDDLVPSLQQNLAQFGTNNKIGTGYLIPDGMG